jgi:enamine deaminase RidA (YjgF/YER057c/UK114 family)
MKDVITTENAPTPAAPLSQGIRMGPILQVSGQLPFDPATGVVVGTTVAEQTTQTLQSWTTDSASGQGRSGAAPGPRRTGLHP